MTEDRPTKWWRERAACADPELLPIVDAAFNRPGSKIAAEFRKTVCGKRCEVAAECLSEAMRNGEYGIWGGTAPNLRSRHGGASPRTATGDRLPVTF